MPSNLHTHDLILRMKRIVQDQKLSAQNIYDLLEAEGYHVSLNSIKRVFSDGSEHEHFRFHDTIQPISRVLFAIYGADTEDSEIEGLKAAIHVKDELITKLERELARTKTESGERIEYFKHQIALKDERIDKLMARVDVLLGQLQRLLDKCDNCAARTPGPPSG